jgi:hypothetical protein
MKKILAQTELPDCKIINNLIKKLDKKKNCEFNFIFQLDEIRKIVSDEITRINLLFPEYTPHDEKYHLKKLFYIADELLGDDIIENMNVAELFLFSVSLYTHDWGMAISDEEKDFIISKKKLILHDSLLDDEEHRFTEFCKQNRICHTEIKLSDWQDYVRKTHAFRSGKRVKTYFEKISAGVAEIASRLCEGHFVDFEIIDDPNSYPADYSVLRETVNSKALAIYLRLVDLLDLGEDRTPYVLWKFVAPKNKFSKMEWAKHRALQPVTFPQYQTGRYIQVDGSTNDHNVYMSIMDLKRYVNDQFKQSCDILNRMNHYYHKLNISHIDWRIAARGFKPIPIQFEFDRMRMFEILGDEIYQNDGYVFIRELIQNSIDAIKVRKEVLENKGLTFNTGRIIVSVTDFNEIYYRIVITDNGIGMDEYIIRNYLSVAGKSYFNSKDFENEGFIMEPISRFGIGVLSCFMISDYIEITTCRDPYISKNSEKLKISIPSKENYFRIEVVQSPIDIGTSFYVYVLKERLIKHEIKKLNITEYIKEVAAFTEFPIEICEDDKKVIIIKPSNKIEEKVDESKYTISYDFPIDLTILPQNINTAKEFLTEKKIFLKDNLKLDNLEGCITFLIPKSEDIDIINSGHSWPTHDVSLADINKEIGKENRLQWLQNWSSFENYYPSEEKLSLSIRKDKTYSVYLNGILLPNAQVPEICPKITDDFLYDNHYSYLSDGFIIPQLIVNVPKSKGIKIDLARTSISDNKRWDSSIWEAFYNYLRDIELPEILKKDSRSCYFGIGRLKTFYRLDDRVILEKVIIDNSKIPIPVLSSKNILEFTDIHKLLSKQEIRLVCEDLKQDIQLFFESKLINHKQTYTGIINNRIGEEIIPLGERNYQEEWVSIENMSNLIKTIIKKYFVIDKIEFIKSPLGIKHPMIQEVYTKRDNNLSKDISSEDLSISILNDLNPSDISLILFKLRNTFSRMPKFVSFKNLYQNKLFYTWKYLNTNHPFTKCFLNVLVCSQNAKKNKLVPANISGAIIDKINRLPFMDYYRSDEPVVMKDLNQDITEIIQECSKMGFIKDQKFDIAITDFVENSYSFTDEGLTITFEDEEFYKSKEIWGETL